MEILVIGSGGREASLVQNLRRGVFATEVYSNSTNPSISKYATCEPMDSMDIEALLWFVEKKNIDFTVVGPEAPLVAGIVDRFGAAGRKIFGPTARAAEIEGSKVKCKRFLDARGIPTADFDIATTPEEAKASIHQHGLPLVLKQDGLAGGKGVRIVRSMEEANSAVDELMAAPAGKQLVIEECLEGDGYWECSYQVITDGTNFFPLPPARDYKAPRAGAQPMTGGMGCVSPIPLDKFTLALERDIAEIIKRTLKGLREEGRPFTGALFAGLMITPIGPQVLEFNCRFGDPELQTMRLRYDFFPYLWGTTNGTMSYRVGHWERGYSVCVVLATEGYPGTPRLWDRITGIEEAELMDNVSVLHAGTRMLPDGSCVTAGGRALNVIAREETISMARKRVYEAVQRIHFDGMWYREDIGL